MLPIICRPVTAFRPVDFDSLKSASEHRNICYFQTIFLNLGKWLSYPGSDFTCKFQKFPGSQHSGPIDASAGTTTRSGPFSTHPITTDEARQKPLGLSFSLPSAFPFSPSPLPYPLSFPIHRLSSPFPSSSLLPLEVGPLKSSQIWGVPKSIWCISALKYHIWWQQC